MQRIARLLALVLLLTAPLYGQAPPPAAPAPAQDGFLPVDSPVNPEDAMPAPRLVAIAYGFIWLVFFGYLVSLRRRLSQVEQEIARAKAGGRQA